MGLGAQPESHQAMKAIKAVVRIPPKATTKPALRCIFGGMRWWILLAGWGSSLWAQMDVWVMGGPLVAHRVPILRESPWQGFSHKGGERRFPGPGAALIFLTRYNRTPKHFVAFGVGTQAFMLWIGERRERFWYGVAPVASGWRLSQAPRPWYSGVLLSGVLLIQADSRPDAETVYRFRDYFGRAILRIGVFAEKALGSQMCIGVRQELDWSSAWDRGLFRSYAALAHHTTLTLCLSYQLWPRRATTSTPSVP